MRRIERLLYGQSYQLRHVTIAVESPSDTFDIAAQLLVELALAPSVEDLLKMLVARSAESPELISLQIWLVQKMDGSLQIAAASGKVPPACSAARIPALTGILRKIVATLRQVALRDSDSEWKQLDHPDWLQQEGVRGFICAPITFKEEILGTMVIYLREPPTNEQRAWTPIYANQIGAAIANARAFEEIQWLKAQLEQQNVYGSYAGTTGFNGQAWQGVPFNRIITRRAHVLHSSEKILWMEENDPRGENSGTWVINLNGTPANDFAGTTFMDSPAVFHGQSCTFSWTDGHSSSRKWMDAATINYASDNDPSGSKYGNPPSEASTIRDITFVKHAYASEDRNAHRTFARL